jgi:RimJ/RimL family protein N-acetyltransferase
MPKPGPNDLRDTEVVSILFRPPLEFPHSIAIKLSSQPTPSMQPILHHASISMRRFLPEDASELHSAARESMEHLRAWMTWCQPDYSLEDSRAFILKAEEAWRRDEAYSFAIFDRKDKTFLGSIGLSRVCRIHSFANLGYWVRNSRTRSGVATAAALLMARFGLKDLGLKRLEFLVPAGNMASQRVAQKVGAKFEGVLRNRLVLGGISHDAVVYSLVAQDLAAEGESKNPGE